MRWGHGLLVLATSLQVASANVNIADRYALPPSKVYIDVCRREALLLHPGVIDKQQMLHRHDDFWLQFDIQARDGTKWIVLCDEGTGRIIREQKMIDDAH